MSGKFEYSLSPNDLYLLITTQLMQYDAEKEYLEKVAKTEEEKEDTRNGMRLISQAVKILLRDLYTSKRFMIALKQFCREHDFNIDSAKLISDIIASKYEETAGSTFH